MIKFAICDDQIDITNHIKECIERYDFNCEYEIKCFNNGLSLSQSAVDFDLVFLDIEMPGQNGIEIAKEIRVNNKDIQFVYVTDYSEYAISAFAVHPFDFVLKPVTPQKIAGVINDFIEYKMKEKLSPIAEFKGTHGNIILNLSDIMYLEYYDNRRIHVYTNNNVFDIKGSLGDFISKFSDYDFYCPHKSFLINLRYIENVNKKYAIMKNGEQIPISQKKYPEFKKQLYAYFHAYI